MIHDRSERGPEEEVLEQLVHFGGLPGPTPVHRCGYLLEISDPLVKDDDPVLPAPLLDGVLRDDVEIGALPVPCRVDERLAFPYSLEVPVDGRVRGLVRVEDRVESRVERTSHCAEAGTVVLRALRMRFVSASYACRSSVVSSTPT